MEDIIRKRLEHNRVLEEKADDFRISLNVQISISQPEIGYTPDQRNRIFNLLISSSPPLSSMSSRKMPPHNPIILPGTDCLPKLTDFKILQCRNCNLRSCRQWDKDPRGRNCPFCLSLYERDTIWEVRGRWECWICGSSFRLRYISFCCGQPARAPTNRGYWEGVKVIERRNVSIFCDDVEEIVAEEVGRHNGRILERRRGVKMFLDVQIMTAMENIVLGRRNHIGYCKRMTMAVGHGWMYRKGYHDRTLNTLLTNLGTNLPAFSFIYVPSSPNHIIHSRRNLSPRRRCSSRHYRRRTEPPILHS